MSDLSEPPRSLLPAEPGADAAEPISPRLGETLVARKLLTPTQLQQALDEQQLLRQRRLGELLLVEQIVTPAALAAAIERQARMPSVRIGEALVALGFIDAGQLEQALAQQRRERSLPLGELLVDKGWITPADLQLALVRKMGFPLVDASRFPLDPQLLQRLPAHEAQRLPALPLMLHRGRLVVALEHPSRRRDLDALAQACQGRVLPVLAREGTLAPAVAEAYRTLGSPGLRIGEGPAPVPAAAQGPREATTLLAAWLREALAAGAQALYVECPAAPATGALRWRTAQGLQHRASLPPGQGQALLAALREAAGLAKAEPGMPQQALLTMTEPALQASLWLLPTHAGAQDAVLHLQPPRQPLGLAALGLPGTQLQALQKLLQGPGGLLPCAGLAEPACQLAAHALLAALGSPGRRCCTVEEHLPVLQADARQWWLPPGTPPGMAAAGRWLLHGGADVLLLGALRDADTAALALQAAAQGCWVIAPLRARSLQQALARLQALGLDAQDRAEALRGLLLLQGTPGLGSTQGAQAGALLYTGTALHEAAA